jgi:hypothetical protein
LRAALHRNPQKASISIGFTETSRIRKRAKELSQEIKVADCELG